MKQSRGSAGGKGGNRSLGISGEQAALDYFMEQGYILRERNYRVPCGEIDLILEKDRELVFVEVKARRSSRYGLPQEAVKSAKQRRIMRAAMWYVQERRLHNRLMRFDVISVMFRSAKDFTINHIPFAFDATDSGLF